MKINYYYFLLIGYLFGISSLSAQDFTPDLSDYQTSWIANDGGKPSDHVPHSIDGIFVREDGAVATITGWDEGGKNVAIWKDGALVSAPAESGTGSWGRNSGQAVVVDDTYLYQVMIFNGNSGDNGVSKNTNGLMRYPVKGTEWQVVSRYNANTGYTTKFSTGYGFTENMMLVATQEGRYITGLAIADNDLIVALPGIPDQNIPDSLKIFDKTTMSPSATASGGFKITEGGVGFLSADKRGFVWMLQSDLRRIVAVNMSTGAIRSQSTINLPDGVDVKTFSVDTYNDRILVANRGKDLNVLIYTNIYTAPTLSDTFGVTGGIFVKSPKPESEGGGEYLQGEVGHMRFSGPTGVGVDGKGNIYIANMFAGTSTAVLYSYKEATQEFNWKIEGLVFTANADFDLNDHNLFRGTDKLYEVDYTKLGGRLDKLIASTFDPFTFPEDFRNYPSPIICGVFNRKIQGEDFMFITNMYSSILGGYRYDKENYGYIAVPCMEVRAEYYWEDKNGDGQKTNDEITTYSPRVNTFSIYPDRDGNIWMTDAVSAPTNIQFKYFKLKGVNEQGVLEYENPVSYKLPEYIVEACRVMYDAERDEMLVTCYTKSNPNPNSAIWGRAGTTILTYKNMTQKFANIGTVSSDKWEYDQELLLPIVTLNDESGPKSLAFAGDYLFVFLTRNGQINVYNRDTKEYLGQITPGQEVGKASGWTDITYALNARQNENGTYELLGEENGYAKVIHYMIRSLSPISGVDDIKAAHSTVFPNPATTHINVQTDSGDECSLTLITIDGKNVMNEQIRGNASIDVSSLPRGYYILEIVTPDDKSTRKIILK